MRNAAIIILVLASAVLTAGIALAAHSSSAPAAKSVNLGHGRAARHLPVVAPGADRFLKNVYGFVDSQTIAAHITNPPSSPVTAGTNVRVLAIVPPVVTIYVERSRVVAIDSNSHFLGARQTLFAVRDMKRPAFLPMTPKIWKQARVILARADRAQGHVYQS